MSASKLWAGLTALCIVASGFGPAAAQEPEHQHEHEAAPATDETTQEAEPPEEEIDREAYLTVTDEAENGRFVVALGPVDLPAHTSHHDFEQMPVQMGTIPFDMTINGYWIEAVDKHGNPVPQTIVHHLNLLDPESRELFLPIMQRVLAGSHETKPQQVPGWLLGIPLRGGGKFLALTMLHNPTSESYEGVSVRLVMEYERFDELLPVYRIRPFHLDVAFPVGSSAFDLPPGRSSKSYEASPAVAGGIIGIGGHVHKYATRLELRDVTTGKVLYEIEPKIGPDGEIEEVPVHRYRGRGIGLLIHPDHLYRVTVEYDNPTGETIPDGGMGSIAGAMIPLGEWPLADPTDPLFIADYEDVLTSLQHGGSGMHDHGGASGQR
jgi:hypothetical protein